MPTQTVTYKIGFFRMLKNSFVLSIGLLPANIFFLIVALAPFVLAFWLAIAMPVLLMFAVMAVVMLGLSYIVLIFTLYSHFVFDKFINGKLEGSVPKNKGLYVESEQQKAARREQRDEQQRKQNKYTNPKRTKSTSVEEGSNITQLAPSFNRQDLEKLAKEKANVKDEIDKEQ
jgi:hypothetical protein